jgi:colanic acid/amylovoran biosynthesis protein
MPRVVVIGLTGDGQLGGFETQLGNVAILIPMVSLLRDSSPDAEIETTIQLTDAFCYRYGVTRIAARRRIHPRVARGTFWLAQALAELFLAVTAQVLGSRGRQLARRLVSARTRHLAEADIVLDFNGDLFPSDVHPAKALLHATMIATLGLLGAPVVEFVSSPGPCDTPFRRFVSRLAFSGVSAFANREALSSALVAQLGVRVPVVSVACPSWLLQPADSSVSDRKLSTEGTDLSRRPLVGVTLAGYNLTSLRTWGRPEHFRDLDRYLPALRWLLDDLGANVVLLPHVYRQNPFVHGHELINGPDYDILTHLRDALGAGRYGDRLVLVGGKYSAGEIKGMIGRCDLFLSGRLHAAVAALAQGVPTVLLAYGHKHRGFACVVGQERLVFEGDDPGALVGLIEAAWRDRAAISEALLAAQPRVQQLVGLGFRMVADIMSLPYETRQQVPVAMARSWIERSAALHPSLSRDVPPATRLAEARRGDDN